MVAVCHCTNCQKQSGSAFTVNVGVRADSITMTGGSLKTYTDNGASANRIHRKFCGDCGSFLGTEIKAAQNLCFVSVGTLDDSTWAVPTVEIWCESKTDWGTLGDDIPKFPQNPPMA
ncbi:MAG: GFA family protein [Granulosicoccus sp.]